MDAGNVSSQLGRLRVDCTELLFSTLHTMSVIQVTHRLRVRDVASHKHAPQDQN